MLKKLFIFFQYIIPQHLLSRLVGYLANCRCPWFKNSLIKWFIWHYRVDMSVALEPNPKAYSTFNNFFIRELDLTKRQINRSARSTLSPVDGKVSQFGHIMKDQMIQAKDVFYSLKQLMGGVDINKFINGEFITLYLSPRDYHRVHMPMRGELISMHYVPGRLFSVNSTTAEAVPGLFARNERLICLFDTEVGEIALILVGAMIVASINTVWSGRVVPSTLMEVSHWGYPSGKVILDQACQMGHFELGSTVIMLFPERSIQWDNNLKLGGSVKMGERIAGA